MPQPIGTDTQWDAARDLRAEGLEYHEIAPRIGPPLTFDAIRRRAAREKWPHKTVSVEAEFERNVKAIESRVSRVSRAVSRVAKDQVERWVSKVGTLRERYLDQLAEHPIVTMEDLESAGRVLEGLDKPMRRNLGLDQERSGQSISIGISAGIVNVTEHNPDNISSAPMLNDQPKSSPKTQVVDVEQVTEV